MKQQNSSLTRAKKQVQTQREEYLSPENQNSHLQADRYENKRGVSSNSAHNTKNQLIQNNMMKQQRTPIKLLQAKHKHLEVQLAKLAAEVATQNQQTQQSKYHRSSSNLQVQQNQYDLQMNTYASPTNQHLFVPLPYPDSTNTQQQPSVAQSPMVHKLKKSHQTHERSGSNNSAKKKKIIKIHNVQQPTAHLKSNQGLINVHIPGSTMDGKPLTSGQLTSYHLQNSGLTEDYSQNYSPSKAQATKIKIEKKNIANNAQTLFDLNQKAMPARKVVKPSSNMVRNGSSSFKMSNSNKGIPPRLNSGNSGTKRSSGQIQAGVPLRAYFYPPSQQQNDQDNDINVFEDDDNPQIYINGLKPAEYGEYENTPNANELKNVYLQPQQVQQTQSNHSQRREYYMPGYVQYPATTRQYQEKNTLSPELKKQYGSKQILQNNEPDSILQASSSLFEDGDTYGERLGQNKQKLDKEIVKSLESGIMDLHSNLKNLEGKYIDLANFYKQELVKNKTPDMPLQRFKVGPFSKDKKIVQSLRYSQQNEPLTESAEPRGHGDSEMIRIALKEQMNIRKILSLDEAQEKLKIDAVKQEKINLENQLKNLIHLQNRINNDILEPGQTSRFEFDPMSRDEISRDSNQQSNQKLLNVISAVKSQTLQQFESGSLTREIISENFDKLCLDVEQIFTDLVRNKPQKVSMGERIEEIEKLLNECELQQGYTTSNINEATLQIQITNDKTKLDLKKIGLIIQQLTKKNMEIKAQIHSNPSEHSYPSAHESNHTQVEFAKLLSQVNLGFAQIHSKTVRNEKFVQQLESLNKEGSNNIQRLRLQIKDIMPRFDQNEMVRRIETENDQLRQHIEYQQTAYDGLEKQKVLEAQSLEDKLRSIKEENSSLCKQIDSLKNDLKKKESAIDHLREVQDQPSMQLPLQIKSASYRPHHPSQTSSATIVCNEDWRRLTESLSDLISKFLHSMRRLQKVVHKKETNVQKEKQDFELSKKELEFYMKQIKTNLEDNPAAPVSSEINHSGKLDHIKPLQPQSMRVCHISNEVEQSRQDEKIAQDLKEKLAAAEKTTSQLQFENSQLVRKTAREKKRVLELLDELKQMQEINEQQRLQLTQEAQQEQKQRIQSQSDSVSKKEYYTRVEEIQDLKLKLSKLDSDHQRISEDLKMQLHVKQKQIESLSSDVDQKQALLNEFRQQRSKVLAQMRTYVKSMVENHHQSFVEPLQSHLEDRCQQLDELTNQLEDAKTSLVQRHQGKSIQALTNTVDREHIYLFDLSQAKDRIQLLEQNLQTAKAQHQKDNEAHLKLQSKQLEQTELTHQHKSQMMDGIVQQQRQQLEKQAKEWQVSLKEEQERVSKEKESLEKQYSIQIKAKTDEVLKLEQSMASVISLHSADIATLAANKKKHKASMAQRESNYNELEHRSKSKIEELQIKVQEYQKKMDVLVKEQDRLYQEIDDKQKQNNMIEEQLTKRDKMLKDLEKALTQAQKDLLVQQKKLQEDQGEIKQFHEAIQNSKQQIGTFKTEITALKQEKEQMSEQASKVETELRRERDKAQEQMSLFLNKSQSEKDAQEQTLAKSLNSTLEQLNRKEDECEANLNKIKEIQKEKETLAAQIRDIKGQNESHVQAIQRMESENDELEQVRESQQATLENNRDLILKLKTELEKKIENNKTGEANSKLLKEDIAHLQEQIGKLKDKLSEKNHESENQQQQHDEDIANLQEQNQSLEQNVKDCLHELAEKEKLIESLKAEIKNVFGDKDENENLFQQTKAYLVQIQSELATLRQENQTKLQEKDKEIASAQQKSQYLSRQIQESQSEIKSFLEKTENGQKEIVSLNSQIVTLKQDVDEKQKQNNQIEEQLTQSDKMMKDLEKALSKKLQEDQSEIKQLFETIENSKQQIRTFKTEITALKQEKDQMREQASKVETELRQERDKAQEQMSLFLNKSQSEKDQQQQTLAKSLSSTLEQLNRKEDECEANLNKIKEMQKEKETLAAQIRDIKGQNESHVQAIQRMELENDELEQVCETQQATLENNRDLILKLKTELEKTIDKKKTGEANSKQFKEDIANLKEQNQSLEQNVNDCVHEIAEKEKVIESLRAEIKNVFGDKDENENLFQQTKAYLVQIQSELATLRQENQTKLQEKDKEIASAQQKLKQLSEVDSFSAILKNQLTLSEQQSSDLQSRLQSLKDQFETKLQRVQLELTNQQEEGQKQKDLLEEANNILNMFDAEKHEVKAKFKYLMQLIELPALSDSQMENEPLSSYKGRDNEVDLPTCFMELEALVLDFKQRQEDKICELMSDNEQQASTIKNQEEQLQLMQNQLSELREELDLVSSKQEANDEEVRNQLDTASRKIQNYRDKLQEKVLLIQKLEVDLAQAKTETPHLLENDSLADSYSSVQRENNELLQRLSKAEQELQMYREKDLNVSDNSNIIIPDKDIRNPNLKIAAVATTAEQDAKILEIEKKLFEQMKELQCAKDDCVKQIQSSLSQQNERNRFSFAEQEILNNRIPDDKVTGWNNIVKECKRVEFSGKTFLLVESQDQFFVVEKSQLSEQALRYLQSYVEQQDSLEHVKENTEQLIEEKHPEIEKLKALVADLRQDRIQLQQELSQFRKESFNQKKPEIPLKTMQDDIEFFTGENLELQTKVKEVCQHNAQLKMQIIELALVNENLELQLNQGRPAIHMIRDSLSEENEYELENVLTARNDNQEQDEDGLENAMFEVAKNSQHEEENEQDDHLGNYLEEGNMNDAMGEDFMSEGSFREVVQDIKGHMESSGKKPVADNSTLQELEEARRKIKSLKEELDRANDSIAKNDDDSTVIAHIKGTLIQFLKNLPLTEQKNEELLKIIYSMMEFTPDEINELYNQRVNVKVNSKAKLGLTKTAGPSGGTSAGGNTSSSFTGTTEEEEKKDQKVKKTFGGFFGLGKKEKQNNSNQGQTAANQATPMKPLPRK